MDDKGRIIYQTVYESPVGALTLTASEDALTALSFPQERYPEYVERLTKEREVCIPAADKIPRILRETREWLDIYFSGKRPDFTPALAPQGSDFRKVVWEELLKPLWLYNNLWPDCKAGGRPKRHFADVCPGSGRSGRT